MGGAKAGTANWARPFLRGAWCARRVGPAATARRPGRRTAAPAGRPGLPRTEARTAPRRAPDPDADALTRRCDGPGGPAPRGALRRPAGGGGAAGIVHAVQRASARATPGTGSGRGRAHPAMRRPGRIRPPGCTPAARGRWRSSRGRPCRTEGLRPGDTGHRIRTRTRSPGGATARANPPPGVHSSGPQAVAEQPGSSMPYGGPPPGRRRRSARPGGRRRPYRAWRPRGRCAPLHSLGAGGVGTLCGMEPWSVRSGSPAASTGRPRTPRAPVRR